MAKLAGKYPGFNDKREGSSWEEHHEEQGRLLKAIEANSAKVNPESDNLESAVIKFQVADGYAVYVVSKNNPLTLQHVPYGDGYQANEATIRGVNKNTVRTQLKRDRMFEAIEDTNKIFYNSLKLGQIVHYNSSFGSYYRCEVVWGKPKGGFTTNTDQKCLKPVALVGDWREYDLPTRMPDGSVRLGHAAESVRDGMLFTPHESCIWESPRCARRSTDKDPTNMEPICLDVPGLSDEEEKKAALWRVVNRIRSIVNERAVDPNFILETVGEVLRENQASL